MCHLLYEDRVYAYETMCSMYPVLDSTNDKELSIYVDADTRNHLAFVELSAYAQTKSFAYLHPLLLDYKLVADLNQLRQINPHKFMNELVNVTNNITRYESYIKNNKYKDADELAIWHGIIKECSHKLDVIKKIISL